MNKQDFSKMSTNDKYFFLDKYIYSKVQESKTGKLIINTKYCRIAAELMGGNCDTLTKTQKEIFKSDLVCNHLPVESGIERYLNFK